jgi:hypothetical protein
MFIPGTYFSGRVAWTIDAGGACSVIYGDTSNHRYVFQIVTSKHPERRISSDFLTFDQLADQFPHLLI